MAESTPLRDDYSAFTEVEDDYSAFVPVAGDDDYSGFQEAVIAAPAAAPATLTPEQLAQSQAAGLQVLDVLTTSSRLDWSGAALDEAQKLRERGQTAFQEANKVRETQGASKLHYDLWELGNRDLSAADALEKRILNEAPQSQGAQKLREKEAVRLEAERAGFQPPPSAFAQVTQGLLGAPLANAIVPTAEAAGRQAGAAAGGALAAAKFIPHPGANLIAQIGLPILSSFMGSQVGGAVQEQITQATETPEETQQRQQRTAEAIRANPGANLMGGAVASGPFFGPSLAQFARASRGDIGALRNIGVAGTIGGGMAALQGGKPEDIAAGVFLNAFMNEPTKLGRRLGLTPSFEQQAAETAAAHSELPPLPSITGDSDAQQISQASPPDGGVRPSQIAPQDVPLPAAQGGEGVQPGRPGEPLAQGAPTEAREVESVLLGTAVKGVDDSPVRGEAWNTAHAPILNEFLKQNPDVPTDKTLENRLGFAVRDPDGTVRWVDRVEGARIAKRMGLIPENAPDILTSEQLKDLRDPSAPPKKPRTDEERIAELVERGVPEEEARAGIARAKAEDVPPAPISPETQTGTVPPPPSTGEPVARGGGEPGATSIKNVVTAEERAARGIPPVEQVVRRGNEEVWDAVKAEVTQNPTAPDAVLAELKQKPRALTDREDFLILHRQIELQKAFDAAAAEVNRAAEAGDEPARAEALTRLNGTREALQETYDLGKKGGTETARGLAARRAMANADFTLASMEMRLRAEQGGNPLTEAQATKVKEQADTIAKTQAEMERIRAERDALKAQQEAAKKEDAAVEPKVKSLADRIIARLDVSAANAAKSLRSRLRNLGSAPDPLIVLDVAKIAAAKTAKGAIEFAQWSADMIREFGEKVRPFLQKGWDQREQFLDAEVSRTTKTRKERSAAEKEASAVKARITSLANRTAMLQERTAKGDFSPMRKPPLDLSKNPEWVKAKAANDAAKTAYEKSRYEARRAQRTTQQKVQDTVGDTLAASRTILASTDISAPGRQGIFFALPDLFFNQPRLARQLNRMFRSQFSESKFQENKARIESRDNADLYESSELYLADIDHKPSAREEQFKSELAEKIPGAGRIIRGSNRGFVAFLNTMRADAMDAFVKWSGGREKVNPETARFLAMAVNDLTGRGNVSSRRAQGALEWLARYLFSPRLWVSRFNTAILKPIWRDPFNRAISPRARAVVLGQYIKFLGAVGALKWLAEMAGGKMELDPRDSDFGKLQFGSKRYDVMGGIGNMVTFLSRFATGKTKDDKGKLLRLAWDDEKRPERELMQVVGQHLRNKLAPIPGALYDLRYGRHPDRSKVTPASLLQQTTVPITVSDTAGFLQRDNPAAALRDTLINALGVAVKDYRK